MLGRRSSLALALVMALGIFSSSAKATPVDVTFAIQASVSVPALAVTTFTGSGITTFRMRGTPGSHADPGDLRPMGGTLMMTGNFTVLGDIFTGFQNVSFPGGLAVSGTATAGGVFTVMTVGHIVSGFIHCTGATCGLASITASVPVPLTGSTLPLTIVGNMIGFPSFGPITFAGSDPSAGTAFGQQLSAALTGVEISRVAVPEPATASLLGLGLLASLVAGGATTTGLRRRSR